ncbi:MAG: hypothetical protein HQK65_01960 [Desulfamplus sp.]|nr:hypothetical protein [Desulfamplus sp.]
MQTLLMIIPQEAYILVIIGAGFAVMLRLINFSGAVTIVSTICLLAVFAPFMDSIVDVMPNWALLLLLLCSGMAVFKTIFGRRVAENVMSALLIELLLFPFRLFCKVIGLNRNRY